VCVTVRSNLSSHCFNVPPSSVSGLRTQAGLQTSRITQDAFPFVIPTSQVDKGSLGTADGETLDGGLLLGHTESGLVGLRDLLGLLVALELNVTV